MRYATTTILIQNMKDVSLRDFGFTIIYIFLVYFLLCGLLS